MQAVRLHLVHDKDGCGDITLKCEVTSANQQLVLRCQSVSTPVNVFVFMLSPGLDPFAAC